MITLLRSSADITSFEIVTMFGHPQVTVFPESASTSFPQDLHLTLIGSIYQIPITIYVTIIYQIFICLQAIAPFAYILQLNALSSFNEKMIAVSCTTMTTGTAIFNICFALRNIMICYDIITIYHQSSSISICCTGQGGAVL